MAIGYWLFVPGIRSYFKISSSFWKTVKESSQGALKLEVPKMPKMN
jgi:hypothetical protein